MADDGPRHLCELDLAPNEASGLLRVHDPALLGRRGWDRGFWTVLDEVDVAECVALVGHRRGAALDDGWEIARLLAWRVGDQGEADDAEALAHDDGWVYLFGSQHGGKRGPIRARQAWVARFREAEVRDRGGGPQVAVDVRLTDLALHRLINDALRSLGADVVDFRDRSRTAFIDGALTAAGDGDEPRLGNLRHDDVTINVEGAEFRPNGNLLLGLRFPVSRSGLPLLVELTGIERLFAGGMPVVRAIWAVDAIGRRGEMAGVRDLCVLGDDVHLVTGNLDGKGKGKRSVLLEDYPDGAHTVNTHWRCRLPSGRPAGAVDAVLVDEFPDDPSIEGLAADHDGRFFYVSDEDEGVRLRCGTPLLGPEKG